MHLDDAVRLREDQNRCQDFLDRLDNSIATRGIHFASSKSENLLKDWINSKPNFLLPGEEQGDAGKFHLGGGRNSD